MDIRVPIIVKDPQVTAFTDIPATEEISIKGEELFLDGPINARVAVLDFDPVTGCLADGARFERPRRNTPGRYTLLDPHLLTATDVTQVSVFGTVIKTMTMFEEPDALGRKLVWAFDGSQLLVVPRAGEWQNAFYERESHSLQFFFFSHPDEDRTIFTVHSQDIVSHETAHAILDGIAPDLYNATSPQSLAIHEAIADITAVLGAFRSRQLRDRVLEQTGGSIQNATAFSGIAEQFGTALNKPLGHLRDLLNTKSLAPDALASDGVDRGDPHDVSQVLSGALYTVMVQLHESLKDEFAFPTPASGSMVERGEAVAQLAAAGFGDETSRPVAPLDAAARRVARARVALKALVVAADRFKRTIFRGLDYLPPGEASFADLGRAIIASDEASHPESDGQREWIRGEFLRRGIVEDLSELNVETNFEDAAVSSLELEVLVESDWAAYQFANTNRKLLRIPDDTPFRVHPRLDVTKKYYHKEGPQTVRECLFKVSWSQVEANRIGTGNMPAERQITVGTTLAVDWKTRRIRALLTSESAPQTADRDLLLLGLIENDLLKEDKEAFGPDGKMLCAAIRSEEINGIMRVKGAARMLHISSGH
ncbi:MAG: hypothetical protein ABIR58_00805 [Gemmatimonadaceae bacterium]